MAYIIIIVFGPKQFVGSGFVRWLTLQGEGQIMLFLKHWHARDDAGRLLQISLAWVQYQSGRGTPILEDVHTPIPYLEARWILSLRRFLSQIDARFMLDKNYVAPLQRKHDEYLMTRIQDSAVLSNQEFLSVVYECHHSFRSIHHLWQFPRLSCAAA
jgi:hypothetical protein